MAKTQAASIVDAHSYVLSANARRRDCDGRSQLDIPYHCISSTTTSTSALHISNAFWKSGGIKYSYSMCLYAVKRKIQPESPLVNSMLITVKLIYKIAENCIVPKKALYVPISQCCPNSALADCKKVRQSKLMLAPLFCKMSKPFFLGTYMSN